MIPAQPGLFCSGLSDFLYLIRHRPVWSDLVGLFCPLILLDYFFRHLSKKNFIFLKKFIWGGLPRSGLPDRYYNNALFFKSIIIIYNIYSLILFISFFYSLFFSLLLSFLFLFFFRSVCNLFAFLLVI